MSNPHPLTPSATYVAFLSGIDDVHAGTVSYKKQCSPMSEVKRYKLLHISIFISGILSRINLPRQCDTKITTMAGKTVAVTGCNGYVGCHIVDQLFKAVDDYKVVRHSSCLYCFLTLI